MLPLQGLEAHGDRLQPAGKGEILQSLRRQLRQHGECQIAVLDRSVVKEG